MYPSMLLMIVVAAGAAVVYGGHPAANTPAAQFWEQALPGTPMPEVIADLVRRGSDHSPLEEPYSASALPGTSNLCIIYDTKLPSAEARKCLFFHEEQLRPGSTMTLSFPAEAGLAILPHDVAEKVPFANLEDVLAAFHIPAGSAEAAQVEHTLSLCRAPPLAGEAKACATSLESAVQSATDMLGGATNAGVRAATPEVPAAGLPRQPYVVQAATPLDGDHHVACHVMPFPYAVYQCHMSAVMSEKVYVVSLRGLSDGSAADMVAFCHLDTSKWNPGHPAFEVLHTRPGATPVCHFIPYGNLAFIKTKGTTASLAS